MAVFTLGSIERNMLTSLDVTNWIVTHRSTTTAQATQVGSYAPMPTFRQDRIEFTGTGLAYDGHSAARGVIDTVTYKSYGALGYYEEFKLTGLQVSYNDVVQNQANIIPVLLKGDDTVLGNKFDNTLHGFAGDDALDGGEGTDGLFGGSGKDTLIGGVGADRLDGGASIDTANYDKSALGVSVNLLANKASGGDAQGDTFKSIENLQGSKGHDTLIGNTVANVLIGEAGNDWIDGGKGNDELLGSSGNDSLFGNIGDDRLDGGKGRDTLSGGSGNDTLIGGSGDDHIYGGRGHDKVWLGAGSDVFHFTSRDQKATIYDFDVDHDRIDLSAAAWVNAGNVLDLMHDTKKGVVLDLGKGDQITLVGVSAADLSASDFLL